MKTEIEIKEALKISLESNGLISPTAIQTLEWVLGELSEIDIENLFQKLIK